MLNLSILLTIFVITLNEFIHSFFQSNNQLLLEINLLFYVLYPYEYLVEMNICSIPILHSTLSIFDTLQFCLVFPSSNIRHVNK